MADGYLSFSLNQIDMAYVITQDQLNAALADFLSNAAPQVTFAYDLDNDGNPIPPANPKNPQISFTGTLVVQPYDNNTGELLPIIDMSNPGSNNSVTFNVGFSGGVFVDQNVNVNYRQSSLGSSTWTISFNVELNQLDHADLSYAPANAANVVRTLNAAAGEDDAFSLSQIFIDLTTVSSSAATQTKAPSGFLRYAWEDFVTCVAYTLVNDGSSIFANPPTAGYALVQNGGQQASVATATDVEIVLVGNSTNPGASVLIFGMVTSGTVPSGWQAQFAGTTLISDQTAVPAVALMRGDLVASALQAQLPGSVYAQTVAQYVQVTYSGGEFGYQIQSATAPSVVATTPTATSPQIATCWMNEGAFIDSHAVASGTHSDETMDVYTKSTSYVWYANLKNGLYQSLQVGGTVGAYTTTGNNSGNTWTSPTFNFAWYAKFDFTVLIDSGLGTQGIGVVFNSSTSSFPSSYTSQDDSTTSSNWDGVPASTQQLIKGQLSPIVQALPGTFENNISSLLSGVALLVFPGSGNFSFQTPGINSAFNLAVQVQYEQEG